MADAQVGAIIAVTTATGKPAAVSTGGFVALTGLFLSYASGWATAHFMFDSAFLPTVLPFPVVSNMVSNLTILIGMINSRGILDRPPLEVLRVGA